MSLQRNHEITKVAMPRICCGNDGLDWKQVKRIMQQIFAQSEYPIEILVCQHEDISAEVRQREQWQHNSQITVNFCYCNDN